MKIAVCDFCARERVITYTIFRPKRAWLMCAECRHRPWDVLTRIIDGEPSVRGASYEREYQPTRERR